MADTDALKVRLYKARVRQSWIHGFLPQEILAFALPARRTDAVVWARKNGEYSFTVTAGTITEPNGELVTELPSGKYARVALLYLCTRAKLTGEASVAISDGYRAFTTELGMPWQGSEQAREAIRQLMLVGAATFSIIRQHEDENGELHYTDTRSTLAEGMDLWTSRSREALSEGKASTITLSPAFMDMLDRAVPISMKAWKWLLKNSKSPMALDVYTWLCSRLPRCEKPTRVTWAQLHEQFGSTAPMNRFKQVFRDALETALLVYPEAQIKESHGTNRTKGFKGFHLSSSPDPRDSQTPAEREEQSL
jgi:hypothetical protein